MERIYKCHGQLEQCWCVKHGSAPAITMVVLGVSAIPAHLSDYRTLFLLIQHEDSFQTALNESLPLQMSSRKHPLINRTLSLMLFSFFFFFLRRCFKKSLISSCCICTIHKIAEKSEAILLISSKTFLTWRWDWVEEGNKRGTLGWFTSCEYEVLDWH